MSDDKTHQRTFPTLHSLIGLSDQNDKNIEKENHVTGSLNYGTKQMEYSKLEKQNLVYNFKKYLEANEAN